MIVTPAPGVPGAVPFWRGDGVGRPAELGRAIGAFAREAVCKDPETLAAENDLDRRAAENLVTYLREQQAATRVVPSDETIVVERFRDEIGDWRLCVLSPFGGRVHAAWGLALSARIRDELELEADAIWSDDGIVVHLPDADEPPDADLVLLEPDEVEDLVVARARRLGAVRRPLSRERRPQPADPARLPRQAHAAVAAAPASRRACSRSPGTSPASRSSSRPTASACATCSTCRRWSSCCATCSRAGSPWSRSRPRPPRRSPPRCSSTTSPPTCTRATRPTPSAARRRWRSTATCSRELLGADELRELIDPEALEEVERSLQLLHPDALAKDRDALQQVLRRLGDLTAEECEQRTAEGYSAASMLAQARARAARGRGADRRRGALDRGRGRGALPRRARRARRRAGCPTPSSRRSPRRDARAGAPLRPHPRPVPDRADRAPLRRRPRRRR